MFGQIKKSKRPPVETEEEKKKRVVAVRQTRLEAARQDLERREAIKIQAAARGMILRRTHDHRTGAYRTRQAEEKVEETRETPERDDAAPTDDSLASISPSKISGKPVVETSTNYGQIGSQSMPSFAPNSNASMDFRSRLKSRQKKTPAPDVASAPDSETKPASDFRNQLKKKSASKPSTTSSFHNSYSHTGEFLVTALDSTRHETEEQKKKRMANVRMNRIKAARQDLERREIIKIQAAVRGMVTRKKHDHRKGDYRTRKVDACENSICDASDGSLATLEVFQNSVTSMDPMSLASLKSPQSVKSNRPRQNVTSPPVTDFRSRLKSRNIERKTASVAPRGHHSFSHAGEFLVTVSGNKYESEEEKKKRMAKVRNTRLEAARKDLQRREVIKIQALFRGILFRKRHDNRTGEYRKNPKYQNSSSAPQASDSSLQTDDVFVDNNKLKESSSNVSIDPMLFAKTPSNTSNNQRFSRSTSSFLPPRAAAPQPATDFRSMLKSRGKKPGSIEKKTSSSNTAPSHHSFSHTGEFLVTVGSSDTHETEEEKKKRMSAVREARLGAARKDLQRREAIKIQAAARGMLSRKTHDHRTGEYRNSPAEPEDLSETGSKASIDIADISRPQSVAKRYGMIPPSPKTTTTRDMSKFGNHSMPCLSGRPPKLPRPTGKATDFRSILKTRSTRATKKIASNDDNASHASSSSSHGSEFLVTDKCDCESEAQKKVRRVSIRNNRLEAARKDLERREATKIQSLLRGFLLRLKHDLRKPKTDEQLLNDMRNDGDEIPIHSLRSTASYSGDASFSSIGTGSLCSDDEDVLSPLQTTIREKPLLHIKVSGRRSSLKNLQDKTTFLVTAYDDYTSEHEKKMRQAEIRKVRLAKARKDLERREATKIQAAIRGVQLRAKHDNRTGEYRKSEEYKQQQLKSRKEKSSPAESDDQSEGSMDDTDLLQIVSDASVGGNGTNQSIARSHNRLIKTGSKSMSHFAPDNGKVPSFRRGSTSKPTDEVAEVEEQGLNLSFASINSGGSDEIAKARENLAKTPDATHKAKINSRNLAEVSPVNLYLGAKSKLRSTSSRKKSPTIAMSPASSRASLISPIAGLRDRLRSTIPKVPTIDHAASKR